MLELPNLFGTKICNNGIRMLSQQIPPHQLSLFSYRLICKVALGLDYSITTPFSFVSLSTGLALITVVLYFLLIFNLYLSPRPTDLFQPYSRIASYFFNFYSLLDLYSTFLPKCLRYYTEDLKTWPIEHNTSKIKSKMGKVGKQRAMENLKCNE